MYEATAAIEGIEVLVNIVGDKVVGETDGVTLGIPSSNVVAARRKCCRDADVSSEGKAIVPGALKKRAPKQSNVLKMKHRKKRWQDFTVQENMLFQTIEFCESLASGIFNSHRELVRDAKERTHIQEDRLRDPK